MCGKKVCIILVVGLFTSSCATILHGSRETVTINSLTPGTKIYIDGYFKGVDSTKVKLKTKETHNVTFKKQGYKNQFFILDSKFDLKKMGLNVMTVAPSFPFDFLLLFVGLPFLVCSSLIDAYTGSWYTFNVDKISADLEKEKINTYKKPPSTFFGIRGGISTSITSSKIPYKGQEVSVNTSGSDLSYHIGVFGEYKFEFMEKIGLQFGLSAARRNIHMNVEDEVGQYTIIFKADYIEPFAILKYYINENISLGMGGQTGLLTSYEATEKGRMKSFDTGAIFEAGYKLKNRLNFSTGCVYGLFNRLSNAKGRGIRVSINTAYWYFAISYDIF